MMSAMMVVRNNWSINRWSHIMSVMTHIMVTIMSHVMVHTPVVHASMMHAAVVSTVMHSASVMMVTHE